MHRSQLLLAIEAVVVVEEDTSWFEHDDEAAASPCLCYFIGREEVGADELVQVVSKLLADDFGFVSEHREAAQPFGTNVVVTFEKREPTLLMSVIQIGKVKKEPHV